MKFTPGPAISAASGSIGGTTFSHNRFGAYTRKRSIPTDPNTNRQQAVKTNFAYLSSLWNLSLTEPQRLGWDQYGANVPRVDTLGQSHHLAGIQWFIGANTLRLQAGLPLLTEAPTTFNRGEIPSVVGVPIDGQAPSNPAGGSYVNLNDGAPLLNLQFDAAIDEGTTLAVYMGRPQNPTINFYKAPWRLFRAVEADGSTQESIASSQGNPLPFVYVVGQVAFVRLRLLYDDGRYTPPVDYRLPVWDIFE